MWFSILLLQIVVNVPKESGVTKKHALIAGAVILLAGLIVTVVLVALHLALKSNAEAIKVG